ncbi:MAG: RluA family pseudouridine synthase [Planctomycetota bacterium]|jgi:23S rRNA pseudouridine1911/1915/1917 synthase|nr:RluA family pseudouridine synthase [Planctomycetota bacterium]
MDKGDGEDGVLSLVIPPELAGARLDQALARLLPRHSRAALRRALDRGAAVLPGGVGKPSRRMRTGERLFLSLPAPAALAAEAEDLPLSPLYEDGDIVVVDKRPGMVAHPSAGHAGGTLVNALLHHCGGGLSGIGGTIRPGIVHRLDKDTSGCLVAAKNEAAHRGLMRQFMERGVEKTYLAITDGVPRPLSGRVEANIGRNPANRKFQAVLKAGGRPSLTLYRTLENYGVLALVECELKTGRTHQARVHLAHLGSPVLCDRDYGRRAAFTAEDMDLALEIYRRGEASGRGTGHKRKAPPRPEAVPLKRQALHAWRLAFDHPLDGRRLSFEAPVPADMLAVLAPLRAAREEMENGGKPS